MVWINKSITCSERPGTILILTPCEGKLASERKCCTRTFCQREQSERFWESDALKSHNWATNLASELLVVFLLDSPARFVVSHGRFLVEKSVGCFYFVIDVNGKIKTWVKRAVPRVWVTVVITTRLLSHMLLEPIFKQRNDWVKPRNGILTRG